MTQIIAVFALLLCLHKISCRDLDQEITFKISPGKIDCFYENINVGEVIDIEYQVVDGGNGEIDINFYLTDPNGALVVQDFKKNEYSHSKTASIGGVYGFCFDNTISRFNTKTVSLAVLIEDEEDLETLWGDDIEKFKEIVEPEKHYDIAVDDIKASMNRIRVKLIRSRHTQDQLRSFEARDRNIAENNFIRVNRFSMIYLCVMVVTGCIQVILLKSLFDNKSRLHGKW